MCALIDDVQENLNARSLAAVRPVGTTSLGFTEHPGWSDAELDKFEQYRNQGDLFREQPPRLLEPPLLIVHLHYHCASAGCSGHSQRIIDWELTALQRRYRNRSLDELKAAVTRNFWSIPFAAARAPLILVGNQEDVRRRASFTVLGLYYPRKFEQAQPMLF